MTANSTRRPLLLAGLGALAAAATIHPAVAHADQYDFISSLDSQGVYYRDMTGVINDGKTICGWLRSEQRSLKEIFDAVVKEGGFDANSAGIVIVAAARTMCPDALPYLEQQTQDGPTPPSEQRHYLA